MSRGLGDVYKRQLQEWEEENEVTPVARQVAEQVMHASEAEASVVHRLQNQLTK